MEMFPISHQAVSGCVSAEKEGKPAYSFFQSSLIGEEGIESPEEEWNHGNDSRSVIPAKSKMNCAKLKRVISNLHPASEAGGDIFTRLRQSDYSPLRPDFKTRFGLSFPTLMVCGPAE